MQSRLQFSPTDWYSKSNKYYRMRIFFPESQWTLFYIWLFFDVCSTCRSSESYRFSCTPNKTSVSVQTPLFQENHRSIRLCTPCTDIVLSINALVQTQLFVNWTKRKVSTNIREKCDHAHHLQWWMWCGWNETACELVFSSATSFSSSRSQIRRINHTILDK